MSAIKNFGILWERKHIDWGTRGRYGAGTLIGHSAKSKSRKVDFRPQAGVYVLYDENKASIYVGQASSEHTLFKRLKDHTSDHLRSRWDYFSWLGFFKVDENSPAGEIKGLDFQRNSKSTNKTTLKDELNEIEGILIQLLEPRLNKRGANWKDTEEFIQSTEHSPYWSTNETINWAVEHLSQKLNDLHEEIRLLKK